MNTYFHTLYKKLNTPEKNGRKIGLLRIITAIFGGLILATLSMTVLVYIIPGNLGESVIIPVLLSTFVWSILALWISLSPSKLSALLRFIVPFSILFTILLVIYILR